MSTNGVKLPPGPSLPVTVQTLLMAFRQDEFMAWALRRYGDPFTIHMPQGRTMIMFSNPRAIKQIFSASPDDLHAGESTGAVLEPFVGTNSLLLLDGARHLRERRMMMPSFHGDLAVNSVIPTNSTQSPVDFDQFLSTFDQPTRDNTGKIVRELGTATNGQGSTINTLTIGV